jgi:glutathione S-transferase
MQKIVTDRLRPADGHDPIGVAEARTTLDIAYAMIEDRLAAGPWVLAEPFTIADCAAAPGLFFASIVHPFGRDQRHMSD